MSEALTTVTRGEELEQRFDLIAMWKKYLNQLVRKDEISTDTATTYETGMRKFLEWGQSRPPEAINDLAIIQWMADMRSPQTEDVKQQSVATINTWLAGVKHFFNWAVKYKHLPANPTLGVNNASRRGMSRRHKRALIPDEEMQRLFALDLNKRDKAIIYLMAFTAIRGIEVHRANYQDLETRGQDLVLNIQGKGKAEVDDFVLIASPEAREAIRDYIAERGMDTGPLFLTERTYNGQRRRIGRRTLRHIIKEAFKEAGIVGKKKTMHSLRKTAITSAIAHGGSLQKVQAMARHKSTDTTMIYFEDIARFEEGAERLISYGDKE